MKALSKMKAVFLSSLFVRFVFYLALSAAEPKVEAVTTTEKLKSFYQNELLGCISELEHLKSELKPDGINLEVIKQVWQKARFHFKRAETILAYSDKDSYKSLNGPNLLIVEEEDLTDIKKRQPFGFQVLEEVLFSDQLDLNEAKAVVNSTSNRLKLIVNNFSFKNFKTQNFLWCVRDAMLRVAIKGISGFDSPVLSQSLLESSWVYGSLIEMMDFYKMQFSNASLYEQWQMEILQTQAVLEEGNNSFDLFDRYVFIKNHTHEQMKLWQQTVVDWQVKFPFELAVKNSATNLFSKDTFNLGYFSDPEYMKTDPEVVVLGKVLFNDTRLSKNGKMNCATCHIETLAFSDGKSKPLNLKRNAPTILYACLQQSFFHDGRAGSLEAQIFEVFQGENEFNTTTEIVESLVTSDPYYRATFEKYFKTGANELNVRRAIATYVRTKTPFSSRLDRAMRDEGVELSGEEIMGFNLFMGKAACATCHFAPLFNGTLPPYYNDSELEMLAVPETHQLKNAQLDPDLGRYDVYQTPQRKYFFKTPTLRNIALTGPYMHNGAYKTLEEVMEFYNLGGGIGLGVDPEEASLQTLPPEPLKLEEDEVKALIAFMKSLSEAQYEKD